MPPHAAHSSPFIPLSLAATPAENTAFMSAHSHNSYSHHPSTESSIDEAGLPDGSMYGDDTPWDAALMLSEVVNLHSLREQHHPTPSSHASSVLRNAALRQAERLQALNNSLLEQQQQFSEGQQRAWQAAQDHEDRVTRQVQNQAAALSRSEHNWTETEGANEASWGTLQQHMHTRQGIATGARNHLPPQQQAGYSSAVMRVLSSNGSVSITANPNPSNGRGAFIATSTILPAQQPPLLSTTPATIHS